MPAATGRILIQTRALLVLFILRTAGEYAIEISQMFIWYKCIILQIEFCHSWSYMFRPICATRIRAGHGSGLRTPGCVLLATYETITYTKRT